MLKGEEGFRAAAPAPWTNALGGLASLLAINDVKLLGEVRDGVVDGCVCGSLRETNAELVASSCWSGCSASRILRLVGWVPM